ncbi:hypothetical protein EG329_007179 [Mollisiaceae sp. DMI_Dod_QoI]|nr:hypothetical protein EG329_007179 [Helotiales sp. DMI_Dod_QoI]
MTRSVAAQVVLKVSARSSIHYQIAPAISRRHGNTYRQRASISSTPQHCLIPPYSVRAQLLSHHIRPFCLSSCSIRTFSALGLYKVQRPSKQVGSQKLEHQYPRQKPYKDPYPRAKTLQSNLGAWTAAAVISIVVFLYSAAPGDSERFYNERQKPHTPHEIFNEIEEEISKMTGEALPGRPGTLTPEQEEKLREFWIATLQVFGVLDPKDLIGNGHAEASNGRIRADTANSSKKAKKKRLSLFRSKNKEDDTDSITSTESHQASDAEDKYGQTKEFHEALANMSPELLRTTFWSMVKHDHPDALLLRFLRARKWDVDKALVMMVSTMRWRSKDMHVDDDIMKNGELGSMEDANSSDPVKKKLGHDFLTQMRLGKSFLHGVDKSGRPMCFVRVRLHKQGEQSEESLERYTVFVIESARMVLSPPVDTACVVFDMTGFSLANMDYAPVKFMIKCFEANYPESLGVVLVHKAPWVFQGIWKIIKGWLDPVVASKVHFTNNNEEMEEFVPKSQIIKELGGGEDWTYKYIEPVPGENDIMKDTATRDKLLANREGLVEEYEKSTLDWIHGLGDVSAVKLRRTELANNLKVDYWLLDPYVRAKSLYDRAGMINPGGNIQFYPSKDITPRPGTNGTAKAVETHADDVD